MDNYGYAGTFAQSGNHQHNIHYKSLTGFMLEFRPRSYTDYHSHDTVNDIFEYYVSSNTMTIRVNNATYSNQQIYSGTNTSRSY